MATQVQYRTSAVANSGQTVNSAAVNFTVPATAKVGDLAIVTFPANSGTTTVTVVPTGWTLKSGPDLNGSVMEVWVYYKILVAADINAAANWTLSVASHCPGNMDIFFGQDQAKPFDVINKTISAVTNTVLTSPSVTTTNPWDMVYELFWGRTATTFNAAPTPSAALTQTSFVSSAFAGVANFSIQGAFQTTPGQPGSKGGDTETYVTTATNWTVYTIGINSDQNAARFVQQVNRPLRNNYVKRQQPDKRKTPFISVAATLPALQTKTDPFNLTSLVAGNWTQFTGGSATFSYTTTGASVVFPATTSSSTDGDLTIVGTYSLTGSYAVLNVTSVPGATATHTDALMRVRQNSTNYVTIFYEAGTLFFSKVVAGSQTNIASVAYNATTHAWWRIREAAGTTFWETSSDGVTWTTQTSQLNPITVSVVDVILGGICFGVDTSPANFTFRNFNVPTPIPSRREAYQPNNTRKRIRQQPSPRIRPFTPTTSVIVPPVSSWIHQVNQPRIVKCRQQPQSYGKFWSQNKAFIVPILEAWVQAVSQPIRKLKRQQPAPIVKPFVPVVVTTTPLGWQEPTTQPRIIRKRQQPTYGKPPVLRTGESPLVSLWKQPTNQPLRNRVPKRQQPQSYGQFWSQNLEFITPSLLSWMRPTNNPLPYHKRRLSRQQVNKVGVFTAALTVVVVPVGWQQPINQPLPAQKRRLSRQQVARVGVFTAALTVAPVVPLGWQHSTNQPLTHHKRRLARQQPQQNGQFWAKNSSFVVPPLQSWMRPVNQPLAKRRRVQVTQSNLPFRAPVTTVPVVSAWIQPVNQALRRNKRQQPTSSGAFFWQANAPVQPVPVVTSWIHPVNQPVRRWPKRLQLSAGLFPAASVTPPAINPYTSELSMLGVG